MRGARDDLQQIGENQFELAPLWAPPAPPKGRKISDFSGRPTLRANYSKSARSISIKLLVVVVLNKGFKTYAFFFQKNQF